MLYTIIRAPSATLDLDNILLYITEQLKNPTAAASLLVEYEKKQSILCESPRFYALSKNERLGRKNYRCFIFGNYIAYYNIDDTNQTVNILRIFYQKQNYGETL